MTSRAERKRRKRTHKPTDEFALAETPKRERDGRPQRDSEDASLPALIKRISMTGKSLSKQTIREVRAPWFGCSAGMALNRVARSEAEMVELWGTVQRFRGTVQAYYRAMGIPHPHAVCMRLLAVPAAMEADAASPPMDTRSDEDRQRDAVAAWMRLHVAVMRLNSAMQSHVWGVIIRDDAAKDDEKFREAVLKIGEVFAG